MYTKPYIDCLLTVSMVSPHHAILLKLDEFYSGPLIKGYQKVSSIFLPALRYFISFVLLLLQLDIDIYCNNRFGIPPP